MRLFGGKALIAGPDGPLYDFGSRWVFLVRQGRPQYVTQGTHHPPVFDAVLPGTVWHRLMLEAAIPAGTAVRVESRSADDRDDLETTAWQREPALTYRRGTGSEQPYRQPEALYDTWEVLFQRATGRYLQLRLQLTGDGRRTSRIRALRAYYPRFSYAEHYLPKVYREDLVSASFLDRYLANAEGITTGLEDRIAAAQALFDARTCPRRSAGLVARLVRRHRRSSLGRQSASPVSEPCDAVLRAPRHGRRSPVRAETGARPVRGRARLRRVRRRRPDPDRRAVPDPQSAGRVAWRPDGVDGPRIGPLTARWDPGSGRRRLDQALAASHREHAAHSSRSPTTVRHGATSGAAWWVSSPPPMPPLIGGGHSWPAATGGLATSTPPTVWSARPGTPTSRPSTIPTSYPRTGPRCGTGSTSWPWCCPLLGPRIASRCCSPWLAPTSIVAVAEERASDRAPDRGAAEAGAHLVRRQVLLGAAFRIGEARLGEDTVVGLGNRDPQFHKVTCSGRSSPARAASAGPLPRFSTGWAVTRSTADQPAQT